MMKKKKNDGNQASGNQSKPTGQNPSKQAGNKKENLKLTVGDDKKRKK